MKIVREFLVNFSRFKMAGVLNVIGLSVAFTAFAVIAIQLVFQNGYDRFRPDADKIFRVELLFPMSLQYCASGPTPIGAILKDQIPLVENYFIMTNDRKEVFFKKKNRIK